MEEPTNYVAMDRERKIREAIIEMSKALTRAEDARSYVNDTLDMLKEDHDQDKKIMRQLLMAYHKQNIDEETEKFAELESLYQRVFP